MLDRQKIDRILTKKLKARLEIYFLVMSLFYTAAMFFSLLRA